jgi:hypothetical protein
LKAEPQSTQYVLEREEVLYQAQIANNPIIKAIHLQNAESALEKFDALPRDTLDSIPTLRDVVNLEDDLLLTKKGMIFSRQGEMDADEWNYYLGIATVSLDSNFKTLRP